MATFRLVHENFWKDQYIETLNAHEKLLFLLLFTSSATSPEGIIEATHRRLAFDTAIAEEEIEEALQKFFKDGKIYIDGNKIFVLNFLKYQMNSNRWVRYSLRKRLATVAEGKIREILVAKYPDIYGNPQSRSKEKAEEKIDSAESENPKPSAGASDKFVQEIESKIKAVVPSAKPSNLCDLIANWRATYGDEMLRREIENAMLWYEENEKHYTQMGRFIGGWLRRAASNGAEKEAPAARKLTPKEEYERDLRAALPAYFEEEAADGSSGEEDGATVFDAEFMPPTGEEDGETE